MFLLLEVFSIALGAPTEEEITGLVSVSKKYGITYPEIEKAMNKK
ncbi:hypothetical protein [Priestia aryabhattai]|nr:hypothetical protein [Priestia aryabhattai]